MSSVTGSIFTPVGISAIRSGSDSVVAIAAASQSFGVISRLKFTSTLAE
jgi:hypothetical protein